MSIVKNVFVYSFAFKKHQVYRCEVVALEDKEYLIIVFGRGSGGKSLTLNYVNKEGILLKREMLADSKESGAYQRNTASVLFYEDPDDSSKNLITVSCSEITKYSMTDFSVSKKVNNIQNKKDCEDIIRLGKYHFATASTDEKVVVYTLKDLSVFRLFSFGDEAHCLTQSILNNKYLIVGGFGLRTDSRIRIWNWSEPGLKRIGANEYKKKHTNGIKSISTVVLKDQEYIVSCSWDYLIYFWSMKTGNVCMVSTKDHTSCIEGSMVIKDKYLIATSSRKMVVHDLKNRTPGKHSFQEYSNYKEMEVQVIGNSQIVKESEVRRKGDKEGPFLHLTPMVYFKGGKTSEKYFCTYRAKNIALWNVVEENEVFFNEFIEKDREERIGYLKENILMNDENDDSVQQFLENFSINIKVREVEFRNFKSMMLL